MTGNDRRAGVDEHPNDDVTDDDGVGMVHPVGSGPGDPELLTTKTARLTDEMDVVLHDKLLNPKILEVIPVEKRENVGKRVGGEQVPQEYTGARLVELACEDKDMVHLRDSDPSAFGRGGKGMEHLADNGTPFEAMPGITPAVVGTGAAGTPVTHRDHVSSMSFVTDHEDPTKDESVINWDALTVTDGTLVVLMGVGKLLLYTVELREAGLAGDASVVLIERAAWPDMRVATGILDTIVSVRNKTGIKSPATTVIGEVAAIRDRVKGFLQDDGADVIEMGVDANPTSGGVKGDE